MYDAVLERPSWDIRWRICWREGGGKALWYCNRQLRWSMRYDSYGTCVHSSPRTAARMRISNLLFIENFKMPSYSATH
ncbi:unnamed protein product [Tuber melanosporum]|uniref:(Perigord truffle) hypothetical protein n=1 Tax=Tuber melanosporum (strain Mel28) TaxID=656061 RepID=D5GP85_TUBMM|nr:uncharacterized protein GSTUM_00011750001 [Tuber melanosporum]CAZ86350.1 unnamed protein product [Tuber melanosporum]